MAGRTFFDSELERPTISKIAKVLIQLPAKTEKRNSPETREKRENTAEISEEKERRQRMTRKYQGTNT